MVSDAVKQEHAKFMSNPAQVAKFSQQAMTHGYFFALEQARISGAIGPALFSHENRRYYGFMLEKVREALRETEHVRKALHRMEMAAHSGSHRASVETAYSSRDNDHFQDGLRVFQGWLASLFESYVTLFGMIEGTHGASQKVKELAAASLKLLQLRQQENDMTSRHSGLFGSMTQM